MADGTIRLPPDSTGPFLDTEALTVGVNAVNRERHRIAGATATDLAPVTAADGLTVNLGTNNDVVDTAAEASLAIIDDWDEADRAKVNPIAGQAGVQGGSGVITALTQRVVLATDQPTVPVSLAAGGTTQYAEDTAHVSGDQVTMAGVVQQSADAALSTDGDRSVLQVDASGFLKVNIKAGAGSGGTAMADDAAFTPAVTQGTPVFAFADETSPDSVDEGDAGALRMTLDRKLLTRVVGASDANRLDVDASGHAQVDIAAASVAVPVTDNAGSLTVDNAALSVVGGGTEATALRVTLASDSTGLVSVDDNGGSLTVDGTVAVSGAVDTELPAAAALADNTVNPTVPAVGSFLMAFDGTNWDRVQTGAATGGALKVDGSAVTQPVSAASLPLPAGASTEASLASAVTALQIIDDWDETDRAKVNIIAGQVGVAAGAGASSALTQRVVQANDGGKTILSAGGSASASGNNTLVAAGTNKLKVLAFSLTTTSTTAMTCIFQSGAGGTELWRVIIQAPTGASAGANLSIALPAFLFATASATLLNLNLSSANAVHWSVTYIDEA